jgi:hypothetical protein
VDDRHHEFPPARPPGPYAEPMTTPPGDAEQPQDPYGPPPGGSSAQPPYGQQPGYGQYGQPYPPPGFPPGGYVQDHPKATTSMVLGILGVVICSFVAPFAWRVGKRTLDEIDRSNGQLGGRGQAQAGYVLGIIGTVLLGLALLFVVLVVVLALAGALSSSVNT